MNLELKKAIDQISKDRGLSREMLISMIEDAVRTSVTRRYAENLDIDVQYDEDTGDIEVYQYKVVVEEVEDKYTEISLEDALAQEREDDQEVHLGDSLGFPLKIADLGRIAAQSAKQVIIQRMRDAEQEQVYNEYIDRVGEVVSGIVQRRDRGGWVINLGRTEALLPRDEQIPREHFKHNDRIQAIVIEVRREGRGPQVIVSRAHRDYLKALFRREVPEVDEGSVEIMGVARDPGSRAKVAVFSRDRDIDPVGACVGVRGSRIQNIVQELHGERIDIVVWNPDIAVYARNALSPAVVSHINVDESANLLEVTVPDDQFANAVGKKGQHVRLAAKLLGWKIDIFIESHASVGSSAGRGLEQVASVAEISVDRLMGAGFHSLEDLRAATDEDLAEKLELTADRVADLKAAVNFLSPSSTDEGGED